MRLLYVFIIFLLFFSFNLFSQIGIIKEKSGDVTIIRNTRTISNSLEDEIFEYDFIKVGNNSNVKISLYDINGVSADLTFYSNTNFFVFYSPFKDSQDAKIYLFKGSVDIDLNKVAKGSSFSVNTRNYSFVSRDAAKFYVNSEYFNNFFVIVIEGFIRHFNKNEYILGTNTALLLLNGNSLLYKMDKMTLKGAIENFNRMALESFIKSVEINSSYFLLKNIEYNLKFSYLYDYLTKDDNFKAIYSKWSIEDEDYKLGNRVEMIRDLNYLKGKIGLIFNNFISFANIFYFIYDIIKHHKDNSKKLMVYDDVSHFFSSYKKKYNSIEKSFFKVVFILKMYLKRANGNFPSSLGLDELYLLRPIDF